jgi:hypothetical protein
VSLSDDFITTYTIIQDTHFVSFHDFCKIYPAFQWRLALWLVLAWSSVKLFKFAVLSRACSLSGVAVLRLGSIRGICEVGTPVCPSVVFCRQTEVDARIGVVRGYLTSKKLWTGT